jgi:aspartyl-tRNA(Asn)/glutamyl-tRNA(Gln) amidotransferase subunit A
VNHGSEELGFATVADLRRLLDRREISSLELASTLLERLDGIGRGLNAIANLTVERAHEEARRADRLLSRGTTSALLGVPYGTKDIMAARGAPTTYGSGAFRDQWLDFDAAPVDHLRRAGAPLLAKLALNELTGTGTTDPGASLQGPGRNPWRLDLFAGGSSSGSGAAVASGLLPFALGSDTGGSVAAPAALCGVTGIRPTYGLVSRFGSMPVSWSLDRIGVLARTAADCGVVLEAIGRSDRRDPGTANRRFRRSGAGRVDAGSIRVGFARRDIDETADEGIRRPLREGLEALRQTGVRLVEAEIPQGLPYWETLMQIMDGDAASILGPLIESDRLALVTTEEQRDGLRRLLSTTARDYLDAQRVRAKIQAQLREVFRSVDVLASYTLAIDAAAIPLGQPVVSVMRTGGNAALLGAGNLAGLPGVFVPCGLSSAGLPVGLQLVGPPHSDALVLQIAEWFQASSSWHTLRPVT